MMKEKRTSGRVKEIINMRYLKFIGCALVLVGCGGSKWTYEGVFTHTIEGEYCMPSEEVVQAGDALSLIWSRRIEVLGVPYEAAAGALHNTGICLYASPEPRDCGDFEAVGCSMGSEKNIWVVRDPNGWEWIVAHELGHQLGDQVGLPNSNKHTEPIFTEVLPVVWSEYVLSKIAYFMAHK